MSSKRGRVGFGVPTSLRPPHVVVAVDAMASVLCIPIKRARLVGIGSENMQQTGTDRGAECPIPILLNGPRYVGMQIGNALL